MSRKCGDCVNYDECRKKASEWYSWYGVMPDDKAFNASHCARYMTVEELISQYDKEDNNGL